MLCVLSKERHFRKKQYRVLHENVSRIRQYEAVTIMHHLHAYTRMCVCVCVSCRNRKYDLLKRYASK